MHHGVCRQGQSNDIYEKIWSKCVGASFGESLLVVTILFMLICRH
jgi:hypothetical protein